MKKQEPSVPIYFIAGFLESGKTTLIKNMLTDDYFSSGERTLLLLCEEGEEEYDSETLQKGNAVVVEMDDFAAMEKLAELDRKYKPERVIIEYNSVWTMTRLQAVPLPDRWEMAQTVVLIAAPTFDNYLTNMRAILTEPIAMADLVIFNRCDDTTTKSAYRRMVKALTPGANVVFENLDGTSDDGVADEDLPYDVHAEIIEIGDEQFGIWYMDAMEHPERYDGKTIRVKGRAYALKDAAPNQYVFGRKAMTCCANDIRPIGFLTSCLSKPATGWQMLTATVKKGYSALHRCETILLTQTAIESAPSPKEEIVTFQ